MIRVERVSAPDGFEERASDELERVLKHFEDVQAVDGYDFKAYKATGVTEALNQRFAGKCAYCESYFQNVHPVDVEHYRPKGAVVVDGMPTKPGYYWLAGRWNNLLPACILCNRVNRHDIAVELEGGGPGPQLESKVAGKGNLFPLEVEADRARNPADDHTREKPLLLDPCGPVDPRDHLLFSDDGWVRPRRGHDGLPSIIGKTTIDVLALRRERLVATRRERAMRILGDLKLIEELEEEAQRNPRIEAICSERRELFTHYLDPSQPYLAMTMDLLDEGETGLLAAVEALRATLATREPSAAADERQRAPMRQPTTAPETGPRRAHRSGPRARGRADRTGGSAGTSAIAPEQLPPGDRPYTDALLDDEHAGGSGAGRGAG